MLERRRQGEELHRHHQRGDLRHCERAIGMSKILRLGVSEHLTAPTLALDPARTVFAFLTAFEIGAEDALPLRRPLATRSPRNPKDRMYRRIDHQTNVVPLLFLARSTVTRKSALVAILTVLSAVFAFTAEAQP